MDQTQAPRSVDLPLRRDVPAPAAADVPVVQTSFVRRDFAEKSEWASVEEVRDQLLDTMNLPACRARINEANVPGASSARVQEAILEEADFLGFTSERTGLFGHYRHRACGPITTFRSATPGFCSRSSAGRPLNNMDLLDFWKCHLCDLADYLFLLVPQVLIQSENGRPTKPYPYVVNRIHSFFTEYGERTQVRGACVFGY